MKNLFLFIMIAMLATMASGNVLTNPSFEAETVADGDTLLATPTGWMLGIDWSEGDKFGTAGVFNPTGDGTGDFDSPVPDGNNVLMCGDHADNPMSSPAIPAYSISADVWQKNIFFPGGVKVGQVIHFSAWHAGLSTGTGIIHHRTYFWWATTTDPCVGGVGNWFARFGGNRAPDDRDWQELNYTYIVTAEDEAAGYDGISIKLRGFAGWWKPPGGGPMEKYDPVFWDDVRLTVTEPNWGSFVPAAETLTPAERQELYLQMIEAFVTWAELSQWVNDDTLESGGGYYDAAGAGVPWARGNDNFCWTLAALLTGRPAQSTFTILNIPRSQLEDHLEKTLRTLCLSNINYSNKTADRWGGPSWGASLEFNGAAWAAHLQEGILSQSTLDMVEEVLGDEADALKKTIPDSTPGNSEAETCLWNAQLLAFAANKLSSDPRASSWDEWAKRWALNSVSMPGDSEDDTTIVDGQPLSYWISTTNISPDYTLENHGFWHPGYNLDYGRMGQAHMSYAEFGNPIPEAFSFRHQQMWDNVAKILLMADGDAAYPQGNDWAYKDFNHSANPTYYATARGQSEASAFESRGIQFQRKRQVNRGYGSVCDYSFGYQCDLADEWASSWQIHNYWTSASMAYDVAEADSYTVHQYPYGKAAIHRNSKKIVSVSWHPYSQAIHIMPQEGINTFPDPPFYFPWARDSGVIGHVSSPSLENFESTHNGQGMRVTVKRAMNNNIDQYITIVSLPDEATVYSTIFYARNSTSYSVGQLFPLQARWLPESPGSVTQYRGTNWLNMSNHVGFISPDLLTTNIPDNEFYLTNTTGYTPSAGQWFSPAAVVVYTCQPNQMTAWFADNISVIRDLPGEVFKLTMQSSTGIREIDLWPTHSASPIPSYCGDVDHPILPGDLNKDCYVDFKDFALMALGWLSCRDPLNPECAPWSGP